MDKLELYNKFKEVPKNASKQFDNGSFKGTDINSMWRIKILTEQFGPCGIGWYYEIDKQWIEQPDEDTKLAFCNIKLYIKYEDDWSKPIIGTGGNKLVYKTNKGYLKSSDECYKMSLTDAIGNACKSLGIGADIYWETDKTKYENNSDDNNNYNNDSNNDKIISEKQQKLFFVKAKEKIDLAKEILKKYNYTDSKQIKVSDFNNILKELEG